MESVITLLFTSIATMEHAVDSPTVHCVNGITANAEHSRDMVLNSLGIVTVLKPSLGAVRGDRAEGYETGKSLHQIVVEERKPSPRKVGRGVLVREPDQPEIRAVTAPA
jgi:aspartate ammonia-lyase